MNIVQKANLFAGNAHKDQKRWDGRPYMDHPITVVEILNDFGITNEVVLSAGYLHDVVEDTRFTIKDIENEFGIEVADLVDELTFERTDDESYWKQCDEMSYLAKIIKMADIIANVGDNGKKSKHFLQKRMKAMSILIRGTLGD